MPEPAAVRPPHRLRIETGEPTPVTISDDATLDGVAVERAQWQAVTTHFVELRSCRLPAASLAGSAWHRTAWADVELADADCANAAFSDSGWTRVTADRCRGTGIALAGCQLSDVVIRDSRLDIANLRYAVLTRCHFIGCALPGAEFIGAKLTDVVFTDCRLETANFSNASCSRVRLEGCTLTDLNGVTGLSGATIDAVDIFDVAHQLASALGIHLA